LLQSFVQSLIQRGVLTSRGKSADAAAITGAVICARSRLPLSLRKRFRPVRPA